MMERIEIIGTNYKTEDTMANVSYAVDVVDNVYGLIITYKNGYACQYVEGGNYRDGKIINCFMHPESDCIFIVVEYDGVFFCVTFEDYEDYEVINNDLPPFR